MYVNIGEKKVIKVDAAKKEIIRFLFIILLLAVVFIFLRLVLKIFGANPETLFVGFIYLISGFFMLPFFGIFPQYNDVLPGKATIDVVGIIALFCYLILIPLTMSLVYIGANIIKTARKVDETVEHDNLVDDTSEIVTKTVK